MMTIKKWGAFLQPSLKWSPIAVEKCVGMQRTEEMMVAVRGKPQSSKTPGAEQLRQAEVWAQGEGEQWAGAEPLGAGELGSFSRSRAQQARLSVS